VTGDARARLEAAAAEYARARRVMGAARAGLAVAVREACEAGMTEVEAAKLAGVTRMTVRAWRRALETTKPPRPA
jgi:hypothetical protein